MSPVVPRTVSLIEPKDDERFGQEDLSLAHFRSDHSYVLLGEPGLGKSTAFETEAHLVHGPDPITARRFINRDLESHPDWQGGPLFIDGLDEVRAEGADPRVPLDNILARLEALGNPPFRLSCRYGSWLEPGDQRELSSLWGAPPTRILRLNPLGREGVRQIVSQQRDDSDEFILEAFEHGLDAFLWNPQLLSLLLDSVETAGWPDSPRAAFARACQELARERNSEHREARLRIAGPSRDAVLSTAGKLSALMLIAGKGGWTATDSDDPDIISLNEVEGGNREAMLAALESRLFSGVSTFRTPTHRLLAEFLGARYLDERIRACDGVTVRRTLSLLMGHDAIPLPDLRGLSAWLAAANPQARPTLIRADPVGVAFDGDTSDFGREERRELLENLENSSELGVVWPSAVSLAALGGGQGKSEVWELTGSSVRSDARQRLVLLFLSGFSRMFHGTRAKGSVVRVTQSDSDRVALLEIARDDTWWSDVRRHALVALDQVLSDNPIRCATLRGLVEDIENERLPDEGNKLLGTLLNLMYPRDLAPAEVWDHLEVLPYTHQFDAYQRFWTRLADRSSKEQIGELLDSLCDCASDVIPRLASHRLDQIVLKLLARGLDLFGDQLGIPEIYRWFDLVEVEPARSRLVPANRGGRQRVGFNAEAESAIRTWLRSRQRVQYELIELGLRERQSEVGRKALDMTVGRKFLGEEVPAGFRQWCLARAAELSDRRPNIAEELARWSIRAREDWGPPLSDDEVAQAVRSTPALRDWNNKRLEARARWEREDAEREKRQAETLRPIRERQQAKVAAVREHATELSEGRCPPALLHELAGVYLDGLDEEGPDYGPVARLATWLGDDETLVEASLAGFRSLLERNDLPDLVQIAKIHESRKLSYFALPFLAGMAEEEREAGDPLDRLGEKGRRRALGYYLVSRLPSKRYSPKYGPTVKEDTRPPWYLRALEAYPRAAVDALVALHNACVRRKAPPVQHLYDMASDPAYGRVTALAARRMFSVFPTRCSGSQLESLRPVLWAAMETSGMSADELRDLVLRRLQRRGMDVAQRAQWLGASLFVAKDHCLPKLIDFLASGGDARVRHVVDFFVSHDERRRGSLSLDDWRADELARLIQTFGRRLGRIRAPEGGGYSYLGEKQFYQLRFQPLLTSWIRTLAGRAHDEATDALESLASDPNLRPWRAEIAQAQQAQAKNRREAKQEVLSLAQIQETLRGRAPASAADLAALTLDVLEQLAERIRNGPTSDWRQYWHRDPNPRSRKPKRKPTAPQYEDDCRDVLLSDLKQILQTYNVDAQPEGRYADDKRADIRVAFGSRVAIPIEIKRNSHRDIWRAVAEQLAAKYTRAPESEGYGIYLLFWFGPDHMRVMPPRGRLPKTPVELKERLEGQLAPGLRAKIGIVVIDVSPSGRYARDEEGGAPA